jgi:predicted CXXCH cytochrome family protein
VLFVHAEKRGPFMFAHPSVEENCLSCHNPHGSVYARLLNEKMPNLCQDCHDVPRHPGSIYGGAAGFTVHARGDTGSKPTPPASASAGDVQYLGEHRVHRPVLHQLP